MSTKLTALNRFLADNDWHHPRITQFLLAIVVAFDANLVSTGNVVKTLTNISDDFQEVAIIRQIRQKRRLDACHKLVVWMHEHESDLRARFGANWTKVVTPRHPLYRKALTRTPLWAALQYPIPDIDGNDRLCRWLLAESTIALILIASPVQARMRHARAQHPQDYVLVVGPDHRLLYDAAVGLRRLLRHNHFISNVNGLLEQLKVAAHGTSAVAVFREWVRTHASPPPERIARAIDFVLLFVDHVHGIKRSKAADRRPRSPAEHDSFSVSRGRGPTKNLNIVISTTAEAHRAGLTTYSLALRDGSSPEFGDAHPSELVFETIELASVGCESDRSGYIQLRKALGRRRAVARAGLGLPWSASELTPSALLHLHRQLRIHSAAPGNRRRSLALLAVELSLLLGRQIEEVLLARRGYFSGSAMTATVEVIRTEHGNFFRVAVPQTTYRTDLHSGEEAACWATLPYLDLPDPTNLIEALVNAHGGDLPDALFAGITVKDCDYFLDQVKEGSPLLERITLNRVCEPLVTWLTHRSGSPVHAALITARSRHGAHVLMHYSTLSARRLETDYVRTLQRMNLAPKGPFALPTPSDTLVGNPRCPSDRAIRRLFNNLRRAYEHQRTSPALSIVGQHNAYCRYVSAALTLGLALRAVTDPSPNVLDIASRIAVWSDKSRSDYERRISFLAEVILQLCLDYHRHCQQLLRHDGLVKSDSQSIPFLFLLDNSFHARPMSPAAFPGPGIDYPLDVRSLRRAMHSHLDEQGVSPQLIDALTGHTSAGRESWAMTSNLTALELRKVVDEIVAPYLESLGIRRVPPPRLGLRTQGRAHD